MMKSSIRKFLAMLKSPRQTTTVTRFFHSTSLRTLSRNFPGQGGLSEESYVAQAIRGLRESPSSAVVEVMNASHVDVALRQFPARRILQSTHNGQVWIRLLTHADCLSRPALTYQMQRASVQWDVQRGTVQAKAIPVIAISLKDAEKLKAKQVKSIAEFLATAQHLTRDTGKGDSESMVVCGLPNAGKSSLIYCLTKSRTLSIKKKKGYHLPRINSTAGWTLGIKKHAFDLGKQTYSLRDTPGLRPRLEDLSEEDMAYLLATGSMKATKGVITDTLKQQILRILWQGLRRHADVSQSEPFPFDTSHDLWTTHCRDFETQSRKGTSLMHHFIRHCLDGGYGGLVIEKEPFVADTAVEDGDAAVTFNNSSTIVAMNRAAVRLRNGDVSKLDTLINQAPPKGRSAAARSNPDPKFELTGEESSWREGQPAGKSLTPTKKTAPGPVPQKYPTDTIVRLPEYQREVRCLKCAGFVKEKPFPGGVSGYIIRESKNRKRWIKGRRFSRVVNWSDHDIRCFYSRVAEAFGVPLDRKGTGFMYLFRDSLVRTFAAKYKMTSRRKVYRAMGGHSLGGFPVPDEDRPPRFRSNFPFRLKILCTNRGKSACRLQPDYVNPLPKDSKKKKKKS